MFKSIRPAALSSRKPAAVAIALFKDVKRLPGQYADLDKSFDGAIGRAVARKEFDASKGAVTTVFNAAGDGRVHILGLGDRKKFDAQALRDSAGRLLRLADAAKLTTLRLQLAPGLDAALTAPQTGRAVGEALALANFRFNDFMGKAGNSTAPVGTLTVEADAPTLAALKQGLIVGEAANLTRSLAATPPNVATTSYLCQLAKKTAKQTGLKCDIIDYKQALKLKMGGLCGVGQGGSTPPALICLEHKPAKAKGAPILLVGKAMTFDTGGYSLKINNGMLGMKYDKCGGSAVLGIMRAIAQLKLPLHVVGLIPTAENMVDSTAYRPNDILHLHNGVTCEVTNTDAEGRLILADALSYGMAKYKPAAVIDLATLTGGCVVALGAFSAGVFCSDATLRARLFDAADATGERLWHLPLWDEHRDMIRGNHADIVNSAPIREASPIQGAAFLSFFVGPDAPTSMPTLPWAHIDIAGTAESKCDAPMMEKGPTAFGVRLVVSALENWK